MSKPVNDSLGPTVDRVLPTDVLLGRGKSVHVHHGNVVYRKMVKDRSYDYQSRKGMQKDAVAEEVIQEIKDGGGRFLRRVGKGPQWERCPGSLVRTKVKQALRDFQKPKPSGDVATSPRNRTGKSHAEKNVLAEDTDNAAAVQAGVETGNRVSYGDRHEHPEAVTPQDNEDSVSQSIYSNQATDTTVPQSQLSILLAANRWSNQLLPAAQQLLNPNNVQDQYLQLLARQQTIPFFPPSLVHPTSTITMNQPTADTGWLRNYLLLEQQRLLQQHRSNQVNTDRMGDGDIVDFLRRMNQR